jgi:DNA mismatch endonuclease (patch repair protein)
MLRELNPSPSPPGPANRSITWICCLCLLCDDIFAGAPEVGRLKEQCVKVRCPARFASLREGGMDILSRNDSSRPQPAEADHKRSQMLGAVKSRGNRSTELRLAKLLRRNGLSGWRRHLPLPGHPDFAWPRKRVAVFVDGCFWHGCPRCYVAPRHNAAFWREKVQSNSRRDLRVARQLRAMGWSVQRIWECRVTEPRTISKITKALGREIGEPAI